MAWKISPLWTASPSPIHFWNTHPTSSPLVSLSILKDRIFGVSPPSEVEFCKSKSIWSVIELVQKANAVFLLLIFKGTPSVWWNAAKSLRLNARVYTLILVKNKNNPVHWIDQRCSKLDNYRLKQQLKLFSSPFVFISRKPSFFFLEKLEIRIFRSNGVVKIEEGRNLYFELWRPRLRPSYLPLLKSLFLKFILFYFINKKGQTNLHHK